MINLATFLTEKNVFVPHSRYRERQQRLKFATKVKSTVIKLIGVTGTSTVGSWWRQHERRAKQTHLFPFCPTKRLFTGWGSQR